MKLPLRPAIDQIKTFSRTFVERPRFAMVIAIVLSMAGTMAIFNLPVTKGLSAGTKVVVAGTRKLVSGMKVEFAEATKTEENAADYKPFKL